MPNTCDTGTAGTTVLFYSDIRRTFRSTLIGYLHQLAKDFSVVLLAEDIDDETLRLLDNKALFPGLVACISIGQYGNDKESLLGKHRRLRSLARKIVETYKPRVIFASGFNLFENYLRRYGKSLSGALSISCIGILLVRGLKEIPLHLNLHSAYSRFPTYLPYSLCVYLAQMRREMAHVVYYLLAPLLIGARPFIGEASIFKLDYSCLGSIDCAFVFTRHTKEMMVAGGAQENKLSIVPHPRKPGAVDELWATYRQFQPASEAPLDVGGRKIITCFIDIENNWGFRRTDLVCISDNELYASRAHVVRVIAEHLPGWRIHIKPHPMSEDSPFYATVKRMILDVSDRVEWILPTEPADYHIGASDVIVGFPPASTVLFTALLQRPGITTIMVDVNEELRGDSFRVFPEIINATSYEILESVLDSISSGIQDAPLYQQQEEVDYSTVTALIRSAI